jgi:hypothetical protein
MNRTENIERITAMLNNLTDNQIIFIMTFMEKIFGMEVES